MFHGINSRVRQVSTWENLSDDYVSSLYLLKIKRLLEDLNPRLSETRCSIYATYKTIDLYITYMKDSIYSKLIN